MQDVPGLVDHFFRREAGKMVAYLSRIVGMGRLDLAEDVVQDTLCRALETWSMDGLPDNPSAWLMRVARNRAIDLLRRDNQFRDFVPELTYLLTSRDESREAPDDQLRMMLACCHPQLSLDAQVTLILKTLCGFSASEIAHALLTSEESIEKRLVRARKVLRAEGALVEQEMEERLEAVSQTLYLLFSEGYHGSNITVREELCAEAIHLTLLMSEHPQGDKPKTHALLALFCFHAARLAGRIDDDGGLLQLEMQDRAKWDAELIGRGFLALEKSASGEELSAYHIEAAIAAAHCAAATYEETNWPLILDLYDTLYRLKPTPIVALNRAIAVGKVMGPENGLAELRKVPDRERLKDYPFDAAAEGEFHLQAGRVDEAAQQFRRAATLARSKAEAAFFARKLAECAAERRRPGG